MMKIVRKFSKEDGVPMAAWIGLHGQLRGWWEFPDAPTADDEIARWGDKAGWRIDPPEADECGTTLADIRSELEAL